MLVFTDTEKIKQTHSLFKLSRMYSVCSHFLIVTHSFIKILYNEKSLFVLSLCECIETIFLKRV